MTRRAYPRPRWETPLPPGVVDSWGPDVELYARRELGIILDRWQRRVLDRALAVDGTGRLVHRHYVVSTGRQNGKTAIVRSLIGWALTNRAGPPWSSILGLAHDKRQARIPYRAVLADLRPLQRRLGRAGGSLALTQYLGIRSDMYGRHREYHVASREAASAIRGESVDLGIFDEVRTQINDDVWAALEPTTTARPQPLIFGISTAGNDRSVLLRDWWERGRRIIDGAEPAAGFGMTWYAAPDELAPDDARAWRAASPAIADGRLAERAVAESLRSLGPASFRMERLNLWADAADEWLPSGLWAATTAVQPSYDAPRVVLGIDVTPSWRRATVAVAAATADGAWCGIAGELVAGREITGSIAPADLTGRLGELATVHKPAAIAYSAASPAADHLAAWASRANVRAIALTAAQLRHASELFRSELVGHRLTHQDAPILTRQVRDARPSAPIEGGSWYIGIMQSAGDVDAVRACAWASWAAIAPPDPEPTAPQLFL